MTYTPKPSREDVLYNSSNPWEWSFAYSQPAHTEKTSTGNGAVTFGQRGAQADPGATAGDTAVLNLPQFQEFNTGKWHLRMIIETRDTDYADYFAFGFCDPADPKNQSAGSFTTGVDLTNGRYFVADTNAAATLPGTFETVEYIITIDLVNSKTEFEATGGVNESVTLQTASRSKQAIAATESNGNGETPPHLHSAQFWWEP